MFKFSKYIWLYAIISGIVLIPGMYSLIRYGMKPSIDFTGGALVELSSDGVSRALLDSVLSDATIEAVSIQETDSQSYIIRVKSEDGERLSEVAKSLRFGEASSSAVILRNESVGPILGEELLQKTVIAALLAISGILLYVAYSFKNITYGVSAIVALLHDLLVVVGIFSLLGHFFNVEVDTLFVTAVLTTMSFSVHDTIVVFDRIREMQHKGEKGTFEQLADKSLTQTMSRSLANSVTIILMLLSLVLMGGDSIRWFVLALLIGTISGTYSSPFVATPVLILLKRRMK